ncbi:MAG: hypothetical protein SNJ84_05815, partial [Verrucomicrobiia bacterium]
EDLRRWGEGAEVRVHFHVPLTYVGEGPLGTTQPTVSEGAWRSMSSGISPHVEVETYTFGVLPAGVRPAGLREMLLGEMDWLAARLRG